MTLPNFLIIGAGKSGTSAIYSYIKQHPQIYMSPRKELRFFSQVTPPPDLPKEYIHEGVTTLEEYQSYFDGVRDEVVYGESSPMYLYTPGTAERIKATLPDVKLFAILRNPVDRAYSAYTHGLRDWIEPASSFEEALALEQERIQAGWGMLWHYTQSGLYYEQLKRYYEVFDPKQIMVTLHDDLVHDADALLRNIFIYLDVDPDFKPDTSSKSNVSGFPKSEGLHKIMRRLFYEDNVIKDVSAKIFPRTFRKSFVRNIKQLNLEKRRLPKETRKALQDIFREDILQLQELIKRDLSDWLA